MNREEAEKLLAQRRDELREALIGCAAFNNPSEREKILKAIEKMTEAQIIKEWSDYAETDH